MKNHISDFSDFYFFELWLIIFTIYGNTPSVSLTNKKISSKVAKFTGKMRIAHNDLVHESFVRLLIFEIWTILYMVNFDVAM